MILEYTIRPIDNDPRTAVEGMKRFGVTNAIQLTGNYTKRSGYTMIATEEFAFGEYKNSDFNKDNPMPVPRDIYFDRTRPDATFRFDPESEEQIDLDTRAMVEDFWMHHPLIKCKGVNKPATPLFELVSRKDVVSDNFSDLKKSLEVSNKVIAMDDHSLRDVYFYYGLEPKGKSREDMVTKLIGDKNGVAVADADNFLKVFDKDTNTEREYIINARKAILLGVVQDRKVQGRSNFYLDDEHIGTMFEDVLRYCKDNDRIYKENILRKLARQEEKDFGKAEIKPEDVGGKAAPVAATKKTPLV